MTTLYAVRLETTHPYIENIDEVIGGAPDPVAPFKKVKNITAKRPDFKCTLVQRDDEATAEWTPVPEADLAWIAEWARHSIERQLSGVPGYGWASCICGWSTGTPGTTSLGRTSTWRHPSTSPSSGNEPRKRQRHDRTTGDGGHDLR